MEKSIKIVFYFRSLGLQRGLGRPTPWSRKCSVSGNRTRITWVKTRYANRYTKTDCAQSLYRPESISFRYNDSHPNERRSDAPADRADRAGRAARGPRGGRAAPEPLLLHGAAAPADAPGRPAAEPGPVQAGRGARGPRGCQGGGGARRGERGEEPRRRQGRAAHGLDGRRAGGGRDHGGQRAAGVRPGVRGRAVRGAEGNRADRRAAAPAAEFEPPERGAVRPVRGRDHEEVDVRLRDADPVGLQQDRRAQIRDPRLRANHVVSDGEGVSEAPAKKRLRPVPVPARAREVRVRRAIRARAPPRSEQARRGPRRTGRLLRRIRRPVLRTGPGAEVRAVPGIGVPGRRLRPRRFSERPLTT